MNRGRPTRPGTRTRRTRTLKLALAVLLAALTAGCSNPGDAQGRRAAQTTGMESPSPARPTARGWPNSGTTGAKGPLTESHVREVTSDGATLQNVLIPNQLVISGDNVTIRNVHVKTDGYFGVLVSGRHAVIEDSTIEGHVGTEAGIAAYPGGQFIARRVNVFKFEDGVHVNSWSQLLDSYVHDLVGTPDAHFDTVTANNEIGWRIVHNTLLNQHDQTSVIWVGDPRDVPSSGLLEDNYLAGGGYSLYGGPGTSAGIRVIGNTFSTRYFARSGYFGDVVRWYPKGNEWKDNTWADGPRAGKPVVP